MNIDRRGINMRIDIMVGRRMNVAMEIDRRINIEMGVENVCGLGPIVC